MSLDARDAAWRKTALDFYNGQQCFGLTHLVPTLYFRGIANAPAAAVPGLRPLSDQPLASVPLLAAKHNEYMHSALTYAVRNAIAASWIDFDNPTVQMTSWSYKMRFASMSTFITVGQFWNLYIYNYNEDLTVTKLGEFVISVSPPTDDIDYSSMFTLPYGSRGVGFAIYKSAGLNTTFQFPVAFYATLLGSSPY
jgi:hypothetical protein